MNETLKARLHAGFGLGGEINRTLSDSPESIFTSGTHEYWMERALQTAMNAVGWSAPNPSVGCVVVKGDRVLASGFTQAFQHEHAERMAFQKLNSMELVKGATLYVTLEPCTHFGSQPPCVDLILNSPIEHVVIACTDPDPRVNGEGIAKLKAAGKNVILGVLEKEVSAWHFPFLRNKIKTSPVWIGKWAQTEDGFLASSEGESKWISNEKSRAYTHWLRQKYDAILVGAHTWIKDQPRLNVRDCALPHRRNPKKLIFDPSGILLTHPAARNLGREFQNTLVFTCADHLSDTAPSEIWIPILARRDEPGLMKEFKKAVENAAYERPLQTVFCEGGATLLNLLIQGDMLDAVHIFTGKKKWEHHHERYRVKFKPGQSWTFESQHYFDEDYLQEWVKCL